MAPSTLITNNEACHRCHEASMPCSATAQAQNTKTNDLPGSHTKKKTLADGPYTSLVKIKNKNHATRIPPKLLRAKCL